MDATEDPKFFSPPDLRPLVARARKRAEGGLFLALGLVFSACKILHLPTGGAVSLGILPLLVFCRRAGFWWGLEVGAFFGVATFLLNPVLLATRNPAIQLCQIALDYLLPSLVVALFALASAKLWGQLLHLLLIYALKFVCHLLSGALFFAQYAPDGWNPWLYSAIYNLSYLVPELVILFFLWWRIGSAHPHLLVPLDESPA